MNTEFSIVAVRIMDQCSPYIRKILSEEFYIMDSRCYVDKNKRVRLKTSNKMQKTVDIHPSKTGISTVFCLI